MSKHVHGGNVYKYKGCIDFSANCNPLGTPEAVLQAGVRSLRRVSDYPQVGYLPLREAIAAYESRADLFSSPSCEGTDYRVCAEQVICGNGAAELIFTLCRALSPKRALLLAPTFAEYQQALESVGCKITYQYLLEENSFALQEDFLQKLTKEIDIVFLCNPNNPTGILTEKEFLLQVLQKCRENEIFLVVDECFLDFVECPDRYTLKNELSSYEKLFILKAFTKRYAMAGIRLGYGLTRNAVLLEQMESCVQPWNISTIAQECGIAALQEQEYVEYGRKVIFREREYLKTELKNLGLKVFDSKANYLFFCGPEDLFERCLQKQILIRSCRNYEGLKQGYYRIAVKRHEDNEKLVQVLKQLLK